MEQIGFDCSCEHPGNEKSLPTGQQITKDSYHPAIVRLGADRLFQRSHGNVRPSILSMLPLETSSRLPALREFGDRALHGGSVDSPSKLPPLLVDAFGSGVGLEPRVSSEGLPHGPRVWRRRMASLRYGLRSSPHHRSGVLPCLNPGIRPRQTRWTVSRAVTRKSLVIYTL